MDSSKTEDPIQEFLDHAYEFIHYTECLFGAYIELSNDFDTDYHSIILKNLQ